MPPNTSDTTVERLLETADDTYTQLDTDHQLNGTIHQSDSTAALIYTWDNNDRTQYIQTNVLDADNTYEIEVEWHIRNDNPDSTDYIWDNYIVDTVPPHPEKVQNAIEHAYTEVRNIETNELPYTSSMISDD